MRDWKKDGKLISGREAKLVGNHLENAKSFYRIYSARGAVGVL
jgi:hypothetical protein